MQTKREVCWQKCKGGGYIQNKIKIHTKTWEGWTDKQRASYCLNKVHYLVEKITFHKT